MLLITCRATAIPLLLLPAFPGRIISLRCSSVTAVRDNKIIR
jgi:hypothetical protein